MKDNMDKKEFIKGVELRMAEHEGRMEILNKQIEELKINMKETDKALRRLL